VILDKGVCTIYEATNSAVAGNKPINQLSKKYESWFGELDFGSDPNYVTEFREDVETSARIRIHQNRSITTQDAAMLSTEPAARYEVSRVYHALDEDSGQPISDLNLRRIN
jgi:hypothetical protein